MSANLPGRWTASPAQLPLRQVRLQSSLRASGGGHLAPPSGRVKPSLWQGVLLDLEEGLERTCWVLLGILQKETLKVSMPGGNSIRTHTSHSSCPSLQGWGWIQKAARQTGGCQLTEDTQTRQTGGMQHSCGVPGGAWAGAPGKACTSGRNRERAWSAII